MYIFVRVAEASVKDRVPQACTSMQLYRSAVTITGAWLCACSSWETTAVPAGEQAAGLQGCAWSQPLQVAEGCTSVCIRICKAKQFYMGAYFEWLHLKMQAKAFSLQFFNFPAKHPIQCKQQDTPMQVEVQLVLYRAEQQPLALLAQRCSISRDGHSSREPACTPARRLRQHLGSSHHQGWPHFSFIVVQLIESLRAGLLLPAKAGAQHNDTV